MTRPRPTISRSRIDAPHASLCPSARQLLADIDCMLDHIAGLGLPCPPATMSEAIDILQQAEDQAFEEEDDFLDRLTASHQRLCEIIAPITPASLRGGRYEKQKNQIIWIVWSATLLFLLSFLYLSAHAEISKEHIDKTFLDRTDREQLIVACFYLSAAGLGACFYNLVKIYRYLTTNRFDVAYSSSYAMRILLGVVAGYVLAEVISIDANNFSKPLLAMLGGFSAEAVEVILTRFVETLKAMVQGPPPDGAAPHRPEAGPKAGT